MYAELLKTAAPRHMVEAIKLIGQKEIVGAQHNAEILLWAKECGIQKIYSNDEIAWCGLYVGICLKRAERDILSGYDILRANSWSTYGNPIPKQDAMFGDLMIFKRPGGYHVGFYVAEDETHYHILGGNQSNAVNIIRIEKARLQAVRRVKYNNIPKEVKKYTVAAVGVVSSNEA